MFQCVNIISLNLSWQTSVGGRVYRHSRLLPLVDTPIAPVYTGVSRLKQEILTNGKAAMTSIDQSEAITHLSQEAGGWAHDAAWGQRGWYQSPHWSLHYLDVTPADPSLVPADIIYVKKPLLNIKSAI